MNTTDSILLYLQTQKLQLLYIVVISVFKTSLHGDGRVYQLFIFEVMLCTYSLSGRAGQENVWPKVSTCGLSAVRSLRPDREPNIFNSGLT